MSNRNNPCFCGSGLKSKKCHGESDISAGSAFANLVNLYTNIDREISEKKGNVRCGKGCSFCCHEHFNISAVEFYYIMYNIYKSDGMNKVLELTEKGYRFWVNFEAMYPEEAAVLKEDATGKNLSDNGIEKTLTGIVDDYKRMSDIPCMFLDNATKACSIYDFRPLICRTYGVGYTEKITTPFAMCELIPDGLAVQKEMADLTSYKEASAALSAILVEEIDHVVIERTYPIFYFLKIQKNKIEITLRKIDEYKKLSLSEIMTMKVKRLI